MKKKMPPHKDTKAKINKILVFSILFSTIVLLVFSLNKNPLAELTQDFIVILVLLSWGATGLPIIIKKETPTFFGPIRGWLAVFQGSFILLVFWLPAIYMTIKILIR